MIKTFIKTFLKKWKFIIRIRRRFTLSKRSFINYVGKHLAENWLSCINCSFTPYNLNHTFDSKKRWIMVIIYNKRVCLMHENRSSARSSTTTTTGFYRGAWYDKNVACVDEAFNGSKNRLSVELSASSFGTIHEVLRYSSRFANWKRNHDESMSLNIKQTSELCRDFECVLVFCWFTSIQHD